MLPGSTAHRVLQIRYKITTVLVTLGGFLLVLLALGVPRSWLTDLMIYLMAVSGMALAVLIGLVASKERAERKAGYTTLRFENKQLEQRDPYLGTVIRRPGEEYLSRAEFLAIIHKTRESAKDFHHTPG